MLATESSHNPDKDRLAESVRQAFENAGFDEMRVLAALGRSSYPHFRERRGLDGFLDHADADSNLKTLILAFVLARPVPIKEFTEAARPAKIEDWERIGLISVEKSEIRAMVEVCPIGTLLLVSDWNRENAPGDSVMSPSASTRALVQMMIRGRSQRTLDLGTGCGILALTAAGHSGKVFATDVNERAVRYAAFNAKLNRIGNVAFASGDLFQPVKNEKFDLILCNPPFLIGPKVRFLHSSAELGSDHFTEQIVRSVPTFMNEGAYFQMVSNWAEVDGETGRDRITRWFENSECDAWVLHSHAESAEEYAHARSREMFENEEAANSLYEEWLEYFTREKITAVHFGAVTMRRRSGSSNWVRYDQFPAVSGSLGESIENGFRSRDFLDKHSSDDSFLNMSLKCSEILVEWNEQNNMARVTLATGLKFAANLDREIVKFVRSCEGSVPLRDQLRKLAGRSGQPTSQIAPTFTAVVRRLIELGLLVPMEF